MSDLVKGIVTGIGIGLLILSVTIGYSNEAHSKTGTFKANIKENNLNKNETAYFHQAAFVEIFEIFIYIYR